MTDSFDPFAFAGHTAGDAPAKAPRDPDDTEIRRLFHEWERCATAGNAPDADDSPPEFARMIEIEQEIAMIEPAGRSDLAIQVFLIAVNHFGTTPDGGIDLNGAPIDALLGWQIAHLLCQVALAAPELAWRIAPLRRNLELDD